MKFLEFLSTVLEHTVGIAKDGDVPLSVSNFARLLRMIQVLGRALRKMPLARGFCMLRINAEGSGSGSINIAIRKTL